jgi:hypothetical protein
VVVMTRSHHAVRLLVEQSTTSAGPCLTDFAALEALLHKGPLTITQIQEKVLLVSGSMTAQSIVSRNVDSSPVNPPPAIGAHESWNSRKKIHE